MTRVGSQRYKIKGLRQAGFLSSTVSSSSKQLSIANMLHNLRIYSETCV